MHFVTSEAKNRRYEEYSAYKNTIMEAKKPSQFSQNLIHYVEVLFFADILSAFLNKKPL